jgi:hypothetical protein
MQESDDTSIIETFIGDKVDCVKYVRLSCTTGPNFKRLLLEDS